MHEDYDSAEAIQRRYRAANASDPGVRRTTAASLANFALLRGRLSDATRLTRETNDLAAQQGVAAAPLTAAIAEARNKAWFSGDRSGAIAQLDKALQEHKLDSLAPVERPYELLSSFYALVGRPDRARQMLNGFEQTRKTQALEGDEFAELRIRGHVARAERHYDDAVRFYREADRWGCSACLALFMAQAYDEAGNVDSALASFTRYDSERNEGSRIGIDAAYLPASYKRLGELWEEKGDRQKALGYYLKFVDLWKNADAELQPRVAEVRQRIARLKDVEAR
jgi:tetratricopeptide (TPR) repeat protein